MEQLSYLPIETYRLGAYERMFAKMQSVLIQARSESAWWSPARCRGILADLRKAYCVESRRMEQEQMPYSEWDIAFSAVLSPLWQTLSEDSGYDAHALNLRVQHARLLVDALAPLLRAASAIRDMSD
jgi:hypothetical protein